MATPTVTPNPNGNPFDAPLSSEMQDHQQAQNITQKASTNGNPFDEPLAAEKAEVNKSGIPETSYGAATWGAVKGLASDTLGAVKGAVQSLDPRPQSDEETEALKVGGPGGMYIHRLLSGLSPVGKAAMNPHEIASAIHDINQSKDPTGTYLQVAQKTASQGAGAAITALATHGVVKGAGAVSDVAGDVIQGEKAAQAPAKATLRTGASASAADAGVSAGDTTGGMRTVLDDGIHSAAKVERGMYDALNKASGTDLKTLYDHANDVQEALDDPTNIANRSSLQKELQTTHDSITKGEAQASANGVDPKTLTSAKAATQQRYAMETVKQKLFNNESVVSGNVEHGAPETVNVKSAIRQVESLDKPSRYAPEGTPSRLEQAFGGDGAKALKQGLYDAQNEGQTALSRQELAKKLLGGTVIGAGALTTVYEALKKK